MQATILDGKATAAAIRERIGQDVTRWMQSGGAVPCLTAILVGDDPASQVYVRNKHRACQQVGIDGRVERLPAETGQAELLELVRRLNADPEVHGILVQLPLPQADDPAARIDPREVLDAIDPAKDVDAFSPVNVGLISQDRPRFLPCTPQGIVRLLAHYGLRTAGRRVVVIGRSDIVGKPIAMMLASKDGVCGPDYANATVTLAHSRSSDLPSITREADILIAAVGRPELIRGDWIRPGAVVIDVGINRVGDRLVGDVAFDEAVAVASAVTPVPGGIGPLTIAMLLQNTLDAAKRSAGGQTV
ncbi:MAG: bifunctional 5,10-methylenetetrahydrofolate dehydrogenase/5,10-methenyltetrahydrofolate cyclohydrolase [Planctomycetaceae bacterium]|nr:MAG: bifunctional 5,10-methylenetetrahydrofolate dehydrogenase/5,10-methenyltetrahydrofolate cyclohydrolase [Planctomycetaceae bacterium]